MKKALIYSTYFVGEINLLLCYSTILQGILLVIVGFLCFTENTYIFFFLCNIVLALFMVSCLGFASGLTYLILACIKKIISRTKGSNNQTCEIIYTNHPRYAARLKWISFTLLPVFFILLSVFVYLSQLPDYQFINKYFGYIWLSSACAWLLTSTCFIVYKRIKAQLKWASEEPVKEEYLTLKIRSDHRACIIGQLIYLPFFLLFILVLTEIS
ncbi:MAG: hypothetical protein R3Y56_02560 [Akkermansia sp.]